MLRRCRRSEEHSSRFLRVSLIMALVYPSTLSYVSSNEPGERHAHNIARAAYCDTGLLRASQTLEGASPMPEKRGCFFNTVLFTVIVLVPLLGHLLATLMALEDEHSPAGKILWIAIIWLTPPWVVLGPLLYLLFGQRPRRRARVEFGRASTSSYQAQQFSPSRP